MEMNPKNDFFITTSKDLTIKVWNLNSLGTEPVKIINIANANCTPALACFDPSGIIYGISYTYKSNNNSSVIKLYDFGKL